MSAWTTATLANTLVRLAVPVTAAWMILIGYELARLIGWLA